MVFRVKSNAIDSADDLKVGIAKKNTLLSLQAYKWRCTMEANILWICNSIFTKTPTILATRLKRLGVSKAAKWKTAAVDNLLCMKIAGTQWFDI